MANELTIIMLVHLILLYIYCYTILHHQGMFVLEQNNCRQFLEGIKITQSKKKNIQRAPLSAYFDHHFIKCMISGQEAQA